jgi:hypothetical protein
MLRRPSGSERADPPAPDDPTVEWPPTGANATVVIPARAARTRRRQQLGAAVAVVLAALAAAGVAGAISLGGRARGTALPGNAVAAPGTQGGRQAAAAADPAATKELCLAYLARRDAGRTAAAFRALAAAAGGASNVATWCQAITGERVGSRPREPGGPLSTRGKGRRPDRPRGPPDERGRGHGRAARTTAR